MKRVVQIAFFCILCSHSLISVAQELPPIQNYASIDYKAQNQNWAISQGENRLIYLANNSGLLEFDGARWSLYPSPNETIMRSVSVIDDKIYTGCYMEFGYWQRTKPGQLTYTSLSAQLDIQLLEDEEFWRILSVDRWVVFQSLERIYVYDTSTTKVFKIESEEKILKMFQVDEQIYFQRFGKGIYRIENGSDFLVSDDPVLKTVEVIEIFQNGETLSFITRSDGFYELAEGQLTKWSNPINEQLSNYSFYSAIRLTNGHYAMGTISNGLVYLNEKREVLYRINRKNGLANNTVLSLFEDIDHNIWMGLDNGICFINLKSPIRVYTDVEGKLGSVYASALFENKLYLGTNQGLFFKGIDDQAFQLVPGTDGQVWSLQVIDNLLFCGHHKGSFIIRNDLASKISDVQGTWNFKQLDQNPSMIVQGNYNGLYLLEKLEGVWQPSHKIAGFNNSSRHFEVLGNNIFVNHEYQGVYTLSVNEYFSKVTDVTIDTLLKGANSSLAKYNGKVLYAYREGIFSYSLSDGRFVRDSVLSDIYDELDYVSGRMTYSKEDDRLWLFTRNNLTFVSSSGLSKVPKIKTIPLTMEQRQSVVEYENIVKHKGFEQYVLGTSTGYIVVDIDDLNVDEFNIGIRSIGLGNGTDKMTDFQKIDFPELIDFSSENNNLMIAYHVPKFFKFFKTNYQYQLEGMYDAWSDWSQDAEVKFENLPAGEYTFRVRARIGNRQSTNIATYSFSIAKPWYASIWMMVIYVMILIVVSFFIHHIYSRYYDRQRQLLIDQNQKELELSRLQNEQEIIKIRNQQLQQDVHAKSNELAASIMSMVKKNELLTEIKDQLIKIDDKVSIKPVIKIIDKGLDQNENWEFFKEAFDTADQEFFKKIKTRHPDLSPNDLKLCAYLRLNLSSKEIA
ncbi:MAG: triple tyrosine motif-containing protein, partial [Bacteroidota bacterium]